MNTLTVRAARWSARPWTGRSGRADGPGAEPGPYRAVYRLLKSGPLVRVRLIS